MGARAGREGRTGALVSKAYKMGRLDCRLGLSPEYVETTGGGLIRRPDRSRLTTPEQEQAAREYLAGYQAELAREVSP